MTRTAALAACLTTISLTACASGQGRQPLDAPLRPIGAAWGMYQFAPTHNAVFARPGFRVHWSFNTHAKINGGLALVGNTLILDTFGKEVLALDARSGKPLWRTGGLRNIVMSTPVVADGLVFVGTGGNESMNFGWNPLRHLEYLGKAVWGIPGGDEVVALDLKNGTPRWRFPTVGEDMPSPVYDRGRLIFAGGDWHAYALDANSGKELWRRDIGGVSTMASATMAQGRVLVAACAKGIVESNMIALDPDTGRVLWQTPYGHCDAAPAYADGKIFTADVEPGGLKYVGRTVVAAVDPKNGKALWTYRAPSVGVWTTVGSDEAAIAGTYDRGTYYQPAPLSNEIMAFDASSGKVRWAFHTSGPVKMSPLIKHNHLYVGDTAGVFYDIDRTSGRLLRATPFKKPFATSPPIIVGDTMFLVNDTTVYAIQMNPD
jgi:outer membrane protein assembly factor BamB